MTQHVVYYGVRGCVWVCGYMDGLVGSGGFIEKGTGARVLPFFKRKRKLMSKSVILQSDISAFHSIQNDSVVLMILCQNVQAYYFMLQIGIGVTSIRSN